MNSPNVTLFVALSKLEISKIFEIFGLLCYLSRNSRDHQFPYLKYTKSLASSLVSLYLRTRQMPQKWSPNCCPFVTPDQFLFFIKISVLSPSKSLGLRQFIKKIIQFIQRSNLNALV